MRRVLLAAVACATVAGPASAQTPAAGEIRELQPVVRSLESRIVEPVGGVEVIAGGGQVRVALPGDVLFAFDRAQLTGAGRRTVRAAAAALRARTARVVVVEGHTDARGSRAYNRELSLRRSRAVARALAGRLPAVELVVRGAGETQPVASNRTRRGRARNRRVELRIGG